jgi:hypothetical protein
MVKKSKAFRVYWGTPELRRPLGTCRHRWNSTVAVDCEEMGWEGVQEAITI